MYITTRIRETPPKQLSFEDYFMLMLEDKPDPVSQAPRKAPYTRTWFTHNLPNRIRCGCNVPLMISKLKAFNEKYKELQNGDLTQHYRKFFIPKKTGGLREINAPDETLSCALRELKAMLEHDFYAMHHAAAFAYVSGRSTIDAVAVHQRNESRWFLSIDLSKFFPSTTLNFIMDMLSRMYPFALVMETDEGRNELEKAFSLGMLNGGLPMGTPLSPMLTNLIMIPFDYEFSRYMRSRYKPENNADGRGRMFVYTRYADDMDISCRIGFNYNEVIAKIKEIFAHFNAPYKINEKKTHYGSKWGKNWLLGVMLNGDNAITVGYKNKRRLRAILSNYMADRNNGIAWPLEQLKWLQGTISYYKMVNSEYISSTIKSVGAKYGNVDIERLIVCDLS